MLIATGADLSLMRLVFSLRVMGLGRLKSRLDR
jgi:hypothetical protein